MGEAPSADACASCGSLAYRILGSIWVKTTPKPLAQALAKEERCRDVPEVVMRATSPPHSASPAHPANSLPRW